MVWQTFDRIRDDERHANVVIAEVVDSDTRVFGNSWMGLATRSAATEHVFKPFLRTAGSTLAACARTRCCL